MRSFPAALALLWASASASGDDWPWWRGPARDGVSPEKGWLDRWPAGGPPVAWKASVGTGFSAVSVSRGRLYTMGHEGGKDRVTCLDAATGEKVWSHDYDEDLDPEQFEGGPTATPTVWGDRVYTLSRHGEVFCLEAATGKVVWAKNVQKETGLRIPSWGYSGSPFLHEGVLLLNVGESGVALDPATGKALWTSADGEAGYSTPLPFRHEGEAYAIFSSAEAYIAAHVKTGKELWRVPWVTRYGVNAADPVLTGEGLLLSSGYGKGAALLRLGAGAPETVWENRSLRNQMNSSVLVDGFVYGVDGNTTDRAALKCLELKSGEVRWADDSVGSGSVTAADGKLLVLGAKGELMVAPASPREFAPTARARVLQGKCWTVPVLSNGRIYGRNAEGDLVCLDVRAK
jgi:outer membrane protein assembly factor BamB